MNSVNERYLEWMPKNKTIFSIFKNIKTTGNVGDLIPLEFFEALPGETFNLTSDAITRIVSPTVKATLEELKLNITYFKVPLRLLQDNFKEIMGERDDYDTAPDSDYKLGKIDFFEEDGVTPINNYVGSICAYFGIPLPSQDDKDNGRHLRKVNKMLNNAYALIWNDHYRDQNLQQKKQIDKTTGDIRLIPESIVTTLKFKEFEIKETDEDGKEVKLKIQRLFNDKDQEIKILKNPETKETVYINTVTTYPITITEEDKEEKTLKAIEPNPDAEFNTSSPEHYTGKLAKVNKNFDYFTNTFTDTQKGEQAILKLSGQAPVVTGPEFAIAGDGLKLKFTDGHTTTNNEMLVAKAGNQLFAQDNTNVDSDVLLHDMAPSNLYAEGSGVSFGINELREKSRAQKRAELDLVAGTRYFEILNSYFGVNSALALVDVPERIGGSTSKITISQVVQTSGQNLDDTTSQGNVAGYGADFNEHGSINVSVQEHCLIIPIAVVTQDHTYQQGLNKFFDREIREDFFDPMDIGKGFQPIYTREIYGHLKEEEKDNVFGFAPANERYRKSTNLITGQLNVNSADINGNGNSLSAWHFGDVYDAPPTLSPDWKLETEKYMDNGLILTSEVTHQFLFDIQFTGTKISPVDPLGVPEL